MIRQAFADGVATSTKVRPETAEDYVRAKSWEPRYLPMTRVQAAR